VCSTNPSNGRTGQSTRAEVVDRIKSALAGALELVRTTGGKTYEPFVHVELAELARQNGDKAGRKRELRRAHHLFTEIGAAGRAAAVSAQLSGQLGVGPD
jgi:hypothetical protein